MNILIIPSSYILRALLFTIIFSSITACDEYLDSALDKSLVTEDRIFSNDVTATSAVLGIYGTMINFSALSGTYNGIAALTSLSSHELVNAPKDPTFLQFQNHQILPSNGSIETAWNSMYNIIYQANAIIEGIDGSTSLTKETADQLTGEAKFVRAFTYFHLVNVFGAVPFINTTDYKKNSLPGRTQPDKIYDFIVDDLISAEELMGAEYATAERARPNKATATALLARVYLYRKEYAQAELYASNVINNTIYTLNTDLSKVFLSDSQETIWQLPSISPYISTAEGFFSIVTYAPPSFHVMSDTLKSNLKALDQRSSIWVGEFTDATLDTTYYFPYKYKIQFKSNNFTTENSIALRLAEQYLIRAEARANQDNLSGALEDLNVIRVRAGLDELQNQEKDVLLESILAERQKELFTEWSHRWFDLKRTGNITKYLGNNIGNDDLLYPIPANEFKKNPNLGNQNNGY